MQPPRPPSTRERILRGAAEVVAASGLRGSTVQDILHAASVSRRTFYQHFPSTEGVMCDLYIEKMDELLETVTAASTAAGDDPLARLKGAVDAYLDFQQDGGVLLSRLQTEAVLLDSMLSPTRERALDRLVALLSDEVGAHLPVRPDPLLLRGLLIGVEGVMIHLHRGENFPPERVEEARAVVHTMLLSGLSGAVTMAMQGR